MKPALPELHSRILSRLAVTELSTADLFSGIGTSNTQFFKALRKLTRMGLVRSWAGPHNRKTRGLTRKGRRFTDSLPSEYSEDVQVTSLGFNLGGPGKARLTIRLPRYLSVAGRQRFLNKIAPVIQELGAGSVYAYFDVAQIDDGPAALDASISLRMESTSIDRGIVVFRKWLDLTVRKAQAQLREWQGEYERLFKSFEKAEKEDPERLIACKRMLHGYFACESVLVKSELEKLGVATDLASYAAIKSPILPKLQPFEVSIYPFVETLTPPETIRVGRFLIDDKEVDLRESGMLADLLEAIGTEPMSSWVKRNREKDGSNLWFFPIPWSELGVGYAGEKHYFFEEPLALEGRCGGLFYVQRQEPRVNWEVRYALHKIVRSSIQQGVEHWFTHLQNQIRLDERIRAWHGLDDQSIMNTYKHVKKELWISELPGDLARLPPRIRGVHPEVPTPPHLRILYDPIVVDEGSATEDPYVSEKNAIKKFLGIIECIRRSRGPRLGSYRVLQAMLEVGEEYQRRKSGGWNSARALDDAVSVVMTKHRDEW